MTKVNLNFYDNSSCELTPMQSAILYDLVISTVSQRYGLTRVRQIIDAFNDDTVAIMKCGISLLASEAEDER